jgi:hypothetical protein
MREAVAAALLLFVAACREKTDAEVYASLKREKAQADSTVAIYQAAADSIGAAAMSDSVYGSTLRYLLATQKVDRQGALAFFNEASQAVRDSLLRFLDEHARMTDSLTLSRRRQRIANIRLQMWLAGDSVMRRP